MKSKFILLPITLTALAPAISLVGCGDPDTPEPPEPGPEPTGIELDSSEAYITLKMKYFTLHANVLPEDASQRVVWSSSDPDVAKVDKGVVIPVSLGDTTITANPKGYTIAATCIIHVWDPTPDLEDNLLLWCVC